jgi:hypothetical protein
MEIDKRLREYRENMEIDKRLREDQKFDEKP